MCLIYFSVPLGKIDGKKIIYTLAYTHPPLHAKTLDGKSLEAVAVIMHFTLSNSLSIHKQWA